MINDELTYKIIGCAMKVHNTIGCGFQEIIYQRSLAIELNKTCIRFEREKEINILYDDILVGKRRADFVVENILFLEIKAIFNLESSHLVQAKNYATAFRYEKRLLINFGNTSLQYKLIFNQKQNKNSENPDIF